MRRKKLANGFVFTPEVTSRSWDIDKSDIKLIDGILRFIIGHGFAALLMEEQESSFDWGRVYGAAELLDYKYPFFKGTVTQPSTGLEIKSCEVWFGVLIVEAERLYDHVLNGGLPKVTGCYSWKRAALDEAIEQTFDSLSHLVKTQEFLDHWRAA